MLATVRTTGGVVFFSCLLLACELPSRTDIVGRRAKARMSANELHNLGREALLLGDFASCAETMSAVLRRKRLPQAYGHLALCEAARGADAAAAKALDQAGAGETVAEARVLLAVARGDLEDARRAIERVASAEARQRLEATLTAGAVDAAAWAAASFGAMPTPRQAPRGIMGD
ncbi:MAG: hypothetical protein AAFU79_07520 [Myxococcota bacterium]